MIIENYLHHVHEGNYKYPKKWNFNNKDLSQNEITKLFQLIKDIQMNY